MGQKGKLPKSDSRLTTLPTRMDSVEPNQWRANKENQGSTARGYTYQWQKARDQFLLEHPLCELECKANGRVTAATVVDHTVPHRGDMTLFWDRSKWASACATCHSGFAQRRDRENL